MLLRLLRAFCCGPLAPPLVLGSRVLRNELGVRNAGFFPCWELCDDGWSNLRRALHRSEDTSAQIGSV